MKKKKKLKLKKSAKITFVLLVLIVIGTIVGINKYKEYLYQQTYEYKLLQKNYSIEEVHTILEKLDNDYINSLLESDKNTKLVEILNQKYYLRKNLDKYLEYLSKNPKASISDTVTLVNVHRDGKFYDKVYDADISKDALMLVNKYYQLGEDYVPSNIVNISNSYAYAGNSAREGVVEAFIEMADACYEQEGIVLIVNSSYRSYKDQEDTWNYKKNISGTAQADAYAARPGFSEHQSGLALDINEYKSEAEDFEETKAFQWLSEHAHEYGFILRYPKDKEDITGYAYESWHYRYLGKEMASKVKQEGITYEEYYAYYIEE